MIRVKGFTLIELIIVCSIIGILASIAAPIYTQHVKKAQKLQAVSGAVEVYNAFMWYYRENKSSTSNVLVVNHIEKVLDYDVYSVNITNTNEIKVLICYDYEDYKYNLWIYPEKSKFTVMDKDNNPIYNNVE